MRFEKIPSFLNYHLKLKEMLFSTLSIAFLATFTTAAQLPFGFNGESFGGANKLSSESSANFIQAVSFLTA